MQEEKMKVQKWYHKINDPMALIFYILLITAMLTYIIPAGSFKRILENGQSIVIPHSFHFITATPVNIFDIFVAIPKGLILASQYLFIVFIAGGLFHLMSKSGALENAIGTAVKHIGAEKKTLLIFLATYIYGIFGIAVGFENNIALVPVAIIISSALGLSNVVGVCIAVGGIGVGFALSPINPYTVGVAQHLAHLPLFSGALFRTILVFFSLNVLALYIVKFVANKHQSSNDQAQRLSKKIDEYHMSRRDLLIILVFFTGVIVIAVCSALVQGFYINQITAVFLIVAIIIAFICHYSPNKFIMIMMEGASKVTAGALVIGLAASIKVLLTEGHIIDSVIYYLSGSLNNIPTYLTAIIMTIVQGIINLFIPGGSGQALATMPVLLPVAQLIGMSKQLMILAFQVGDGLTNLIVPTSGGTLAMLALGGVSYGKWLKVITPFMLIAYGVSWIFLVIGYLIGW
ncbi:YfcC family protein [Facilibium subflavum]|uniref:YfcC family protein n=1 Tax=Facilibium subflavum TaxID=2219058 RepID=UPI001AAC5D8E|nr:TIGR00366 family protein [Facilibium subflavum]